MSFSGSKSGRYRTTWKIALLLIAVLAAGCSHGIENTAEHYKLEPAPAAHSYEAININTADADELRRIPNIGEGLAAEIIRHRNEHGPFRRPESLMLVRGIGDKRFREIRHLIRID
ncbi:MAG: helix-hairpin-helix domain-containing protein [Acidobacteria bacterium]|nr:helix-hairpin-helix domain-containing protein [Acidobacteriota bacterium]